MYTTDDDQISQAKIGHNFLYRNNAHSATHKYAFGYQSDLAAVYSVRESKYCKEKNLTLRALKITEFTADICLALELEEGVDQFTKIEYETRRQAYSSVVRCF